MNAPDRDERAAAEEVISAGSAERAMLDIWKDEIFIDDIKVDDDFFSLGGDSLAAVRIMIRVKDTFGVDIPISQLLETPILRNFAMHVENLRTGKACGSHSDGAPPRPEMEEGIV